MLCEWVVCVVCVYVCGVCVVYVLCVMCVFDTPLLFSFGLFSNQYHGVI